MPNPASRFEFDPFDLQRFMTAQAPRYTSALAELRAGRKQTHWCWFVLPQLQGLGNSHMALRYGISGLAEARAYLLHATLGPRLTECVTTIASHRERTAEHILGPVDARKYHSCLTLFARAAEPGSIFHSELQRRFKGQEDSGTAGLLT